MFRTLDPKITNRFRVEPFFDERDYFIPEYSAYA
jgi:hypothetical protein